MKAGLVLDNHIVTTKMSEQITLARHRPRMIAYVQKKFDWTEEQAISSVNWRVIGRAKKSLKLPDSIRYSKLLFDWLNVGAQKQKFGDDPHCPCCNADMENQLHLYSCSHPEMKDAVETALIEITSSLVKEGLKSQIYTAFTNMLYISTGRQPPSNLEITCPSILQAMEDQNSLGREAILRGFHSIKWIGVLREHWVPPKRDRNGKQLESRKDPLQQATYLVKCSWKLFEAVWQCRNNILHSNECTLLETQIESYNEKLLDFRRHNNVYLRRCDRFIIDRYSEDDIIKWGAPRKRATIALLMDLRKIHQNEQRLEAARHRDIRDFFIRIARPAPSAPVTTTSSIGSSNHDSSNSISEHSSSDSVTYCSSSSDETATCVAVDSDLSTLEGWFGYDSDDGSLSMAGAKRQP